MILYPLELIFLWFCWLFQLPGRGGNSEIVSSILSYYSYHSSELSLMVGEISKILHHNCTRIKREMMDIVNFSTLFWVSFLTLCMDCVDHQSKIFLILGGHMQIIALYWGCIKLWYSYYHAIFPFFRTEYAMQWRFLIGRWILGHVHLCAFSSLVQREVEIIEI